FIRPSMAGNDAAVPLMLGSVQGGLEVGANAAQRPAPTGMTLMGADPAVLSALAGLEQGDVNQVTIDGTAIAVNLQTTANPADRWYQDGTVATGNNSGLREKLGLLRDAINGAGLPWRAELWGSRLAILPTAGADNAIGTIATGAGVDIANRFVRNVRLASVGAGGTVGFQTPAPGPASDGTPPVAADYDAAFAIIDRDVDIFNLMVLPPDAAVPITDIWNNASIFCQRRRAFLLLDAPADWTDAQSAATGVIPRRIGLVRDYSAIFFPWVTINEDGLRRDIGASGAIAGLMARIDGTRGVWKAPAGTEASLRGIVGLERQFSDAENGILNPRAINTLRVFPSGIVNWGARTMEGDDNDASEWKYIPIRRLALYIEESLYRGLKWVVFEPNDEPLWSQIRLNVGAFMHDLFRQGAFQGPKPADAYFVRCDAETTTQTDRNLGIVNIWVGFAPLKPAEFVVLRLQQMAGQIEV
ncbi:MAG TPA: phage tail sheath subtilisin-like domain-containing protein, partial [Thermomicrobiales bacterium]|nr:phage tail sheath subtilisin-like domain-containing protein [Thermomicrobiales bacterium]